MIRVRPQYAVWGLPEVAAVIRAGLPGAARARFPREFAERLSKLAGGRPVRLLNGGQVAIQVALLAMSAQEQTRRNVLVPSYVCPAVYEGVRWVGLNPVPVEVGSDLNLLPSAVRRRLDRHSLAVIGVHMYGCPAHLAEIEDTCRTVGAYLLDDAAHTIGCEPAGKPLGLAGDVGVLSFNQLKTITTGVAEGAGAIILNNPALAARIDTAVGELNDPSFSLWGVMRFICEYQLEAQTGRLFYYARRWLRRTPVPRTEYMVGRRLSAQSCAIGLAQLDRLEEIRAERMRIAQAYFEYLRPQHDVLMPQFSPGRYLSRIVVRFRDKTRRDSVRTALARIGVVSRLPYRAWCDASDPAYLASRELEEQLLELPSPLGMAESEVRDIASVMRWAAC